MIKIHNNQIKVCVKDQNSHSRCVLFMCINVHGYTFFAKNELYAGKSDMKNQKNLVLFCHLSSDTLKPYRTM